MQFKNSNLYSHLAKVLLKNLIRLAVIGFISSLLLQIRNKSCVTNENCRPFYFGREVQKIVRNLKNPVDKKDSDVVKVNFFGLSDKPEISVNISKNSDLVEIDQPKIINFEVKNNGSSSIEILPDFHTNPTTDEQYIIKHQCLCSAKFRLAAGESKQIKIVYEIDRKAAINRRLEMKFFYVF
jgi:cytochrome c oxidase assembly protein Cox11